jgi:2-hydroxychromene-2-carboxylate isomerase
MTDRVRFHFDTLCPWCWQTSKWVRRLVELGEIEASWGTFSLELQNADDPGAVQGNSIAERSLRTAVAVRNKEGEDALGRFYLAIGTAYHERGEALDDPAVVRAALTEAGLDEVLQEQAMSDDATWEAVVAEHRELVETTRSFGVPTIVLDGGEGPAIFGPVIYAVPSDSDAVELFRHVEWLTRYDNFSELKRDRDRMPDLASVRGFKARREAEQAAEAEQAEA